MNHRHPAGGWKRPSTTLKAMAWALTLASTANFAQAATGATVDGFPVWSTQTLQLRDLAIEVKDLNLADTSAPEFRFLSAAAESGGQSTLLMSSGYFGVSASKLLDTTVLLPADGQWVHTNGVASLAVQGNNATLNTQTRFGLEEQQVAWGRLPADNAEISLDSSQQFSLGAHASVTFSGVFQLTQSMDLSLLASLNVQKTPDFFIGTLDAHATLDAGFLEQGQWVDVQKLPQRFVSPLSDSHLSSLFENPVLNGVDWSQAQNQSIAFSITLTNDTDAARVGRVDLRMTNNAFYELGLPNAPVPEPGAGAMLALGLTALAAVARRRRVLQA